MEFLNPSPLETALLSLFHEFYSNVGFPNPAHIQLIRRENTGAGRFVYLQVEVDSQLEDGYLDMAGSFIEMEGVTQGLMAVVHVKDHRPDFLEIVTYGNSSWDGEERPWSIV